MQMQRLVYGPLKSAAGRGPVGSLAGHPFLIVIDGLDECNDKDEIEDLIDGMLAFFDENPFIPLRVFITSRVEQHIQSRLNVPGVLLDNLVDHCSNDDIAAFLDVLFQDARRRSPVIQAYVREHEEWPTPSEKQKLVKHIGGSFIFAWAVFKFIMESDTSNSHPKTPMDRLPLTLKMNPGLDGLYAQVLARSEHIPHFLDIISTIALLEEPLPTSGIAELLGISTYEVVNVLVNLQAIIQVPGTDDTPVTICHTSLRNFLTTENRSGQFFAHPHHHVRLYLRSFECELELRRQRPGVPIHLSECTPAVAYSRKYFITHSYRGISFSEIWEWDLAIRVGREALELHPSSPELVYALADAFHGRAILKKSLEDYEEAISLHREALLLRPSPHEDRWMSLRSVGSTLLDRDRFARTTLGLEEAISLNRVALELLPSSHPERWLLLNNFGHTLLDRYWQMGTIADLEEGISLHREALELRPSLHPERSDSHSSLFSSLLALYKETHALPHLQEAITHCEELLDSYYPVGHKDRVKTLNDLVSLLEIHFEATGRQEDLPRIELLKEEAGRLEAAESAS
ncbi:hypothetical protein H1R20_g9725, partial [Candolleomyces eurysporus]